MNKLQKLSHQAVRSASSLGRLTAIEGKSLALSLGGTQSFFVGIVKTDPGSAVIGPVQEACPHVEYPASA